jgi:arylsulfatase A-like enzyme
VREVTGPLYRFLLRPGSVGALYLALLALRAGAAAGADAALGRDGNQLTAFVNDRFAGEVLRVTVAIGALAIAVGAVIGMLAGVVVMLRDRMARAPRRSPLRRAWAVLGVSAAFHAWLVLRGMAAAPQLYADGWYAQGGLRRMVQVFVTDVMGPGGMTALGVLALVAYLAGPSSRWRGWPRRLGRAFLPRRVRALGVAAAALAVMAAVASSSAPLAVPTAKAQGPAAPPSTARPNVLVLAADSLRADRLTPAIAPRLTELAAKGARFDRAYVSLPRTFPSWVSLLTGRHPHHHGIRSMFPRWEERAKDFDALPARLAAAGYRTEVVSDYAGDIFGRIDLGFGRLEVPTFDFRQLVRQRALEQQTPLLPILHSRVGRAAFPVMRELSDAADPGLLADDAIRAISRPGGAPFFVTVFFSTAHFPYAAPAPYYGRFTQSGYRGRFKYHKPVGLGPEAPPDAEDIEQIRGLYDGAVASVDAACGRILDALDALAKTQGPTIVVIAADHGETLYEAEHGQGHGDHLFGDEGTHIPLVVVDPRRPQAVRSRAIVRDVDLAPTLYELTGVAPPADLDGRSLAPALTGAELPAALAFAETGLWFTEDIPGLPSSLRLPYPGIARMTELDAAHGDEVVLQRGVRPLTIVAKHRMARDDRYKLVYAPTRMGAKYMLFDTQADPDEAKDVAESHPAEVARLKSELHAWMTRDPEMRISGDMLVPRDLSGLAATPTGVRLGAP